MYSIVSLFGNTHGAIRLAGGIVETLRRLLDSLNSRNRY